MRQFQIPPDMKEKEKVIGGVLTLNQFFWLLGGGILGAMVFMGLFKIVGGVFSLILGLIIALSGVPFALCKKKGFPLFQYLSLKKKFKNKQKYLPNNREEVTK